MNGLLIVVNFNQEPEIARFLANLRSVDHGLETIVVDDASTDRSPDIARDYGYEVLRHQCNRGVGAAIRSGIQYALRGGRYDYVAIMSSNGKMLPRDLPRIVAHITDGTADYVQGSRFIKGGQAPGLTWFRRVGIPAYSLLASVLLGRRFTDITCGFRAYCLWLVRDKRVRLEQSWLDQYEAELYIHYYACTLGARIVEVPVTIDYSHLPRGRRSKIVPVVGWWSLLRPFLLLALGFRR